jgi:hypothetical protein
MGAALDVLGLQIDDLPVGLLDDVLERHPRLDLKTWLGEAMVAQAAAKPESRAAVLTRDFALPALIAAAPFES